MTAFAASRLVVSLLLLVCDCGQLQSVVFFVLLWLQYVIVSAPVDITCSLNGDDTF